MHHSGILCNKTKESLKDIVFGKKNIRPKCHVWKATAHTHIHMQLKIIGLIEMYRMLKNPETIWSAKTENPAIC